MARLESGSQVFGESGVIERAAIEPVMQAAERPLECQLRRTPAATQEMELLQTASGAPRRQCRHRSTREVDL